MLCLLGLVLALLVSTEGARLSKEEKQAILDLHNSLRSRVALGKQPGQPPAADMTLMEWDERPSVTASQWADSCSKDFHKQGADIKFGPYTYVGQNVMHWPTAGMDVAQWRRFVQQWYDEAKDYDYNGKRCIQMCGHYTQIVWANTILIGCGKATCRDAWLKEKAVCDYAPGGNWRGQAAYTRGTACSACPSNYKKCHKGLCATEQQCSQSGVLCTNSKTTNKALTRDAAQNPDRIIARVVN